MNGTCLYLPPPAETILGSIRIMEAFVSYFPHFAIYIFQLN